MFSEPVHPTWQGFSDWVEQSGVINITAAIAELDRLKAENDRLVRHARQLLLLKMREYSEDRFAAGWHQGLSLRLWKEILKKGTQVVAGRWESWERDLLDEIERLSADCGGWWHWPDDAEEERFVEAEEWERIVAEQGTTR